VYEADHVRYHWDEMPPSGAPHHPHVIRSGRHGLGDRTERLAVDRRHLESEDLVVVEFVLAGWGQVALADEDTAPDQRLGRIAVIDAWQGDQHEAPAEWRRRQHGDLAPPTARLFEEDRPAVTQARRGGMIDSDADDAPQSVGRHHLADGDHGGLTSLRRFRGWPCDWCGRRRHSGSS